MNGRLLALFCGAYLAGSASGVTFLPSVAVGWGLLASGMIAGLVLLRWLVPAAGCLAVSGLWLGVWQGTGYTSQRYYLWRTLPQQEAVVAWGSIVSEPTRRSGNWRFVLRTHYLSVGEKVWRTPVYLWVQVPEELLQQPFAGDHLEVEGRLRVPAPTPRDPSGTFAKYLFRRGVYRTLRAYRVHKVSDSGWRVRFSQLRSWLILNLRHHLPTREGNVAAAIVLNDRSKLDEQTRDGFRRTGTIHILSPSGTHVSMVALSVWWVTQWVGVSRRWRAALVVVVIWLFAAVSAGGEPAFRAAVMGSIVAGGVGLHREVDLPTALALAGFLIAFYDPSALLDPGYQFSFTLVAAILASAGWIQALAERFSSRVVSLLVSALSVSGVCSAAAAPLTSLYYGQVSVIAPLANLVIAAPVQLITSVGLLVSGLPNLPEWLCAPIAASAWFVELSVRVMARLPWACLEVSSPSRGELLGGYTLFFGMMMWLSWRASNRQRRWQQ